MRKRRDAVAEMLRADEIENAPTEAVPRRKRRTTAELRFTEDLSERVMENAGIVYAVLKKHFRGCERLFPGTRGDFVQTGLLAIASAIRDYRPDRGAQLVTIATINVRNKLLNLVQSLESAKQRDALALLAEREAIVHSPLDQLIALEELGSPV